MRLVWTEEEYGTGDPIVDAQHRELFNRANYLLDAAAGVSPEREVRLTLQFLSAYVVTHFSTEEQAMALAGSPTAARNREEHKWFVGRLGQLQQQFRDEGVTPGLVDEFTQLLVHWVGTHIRETDTGLRG